MKSTNKKCFDRVVWMGSKPSNALRAELLAQLLNFLGYEGVLESALSGSASRQLVLGNAEDHAADWPRPNGETLFLGLFSKNYPDSQLLLGNFDNSKVSFYINEAVKLEEIQEFIADLLLS